MGGIEYADKRNIKELLDLAYHARIASNRHEAFDILASLADRLIEMYGEDENVGD